MAADLVFRVACSLIGIGLALVVLYVGWHYEKRCKA